MGGGGGCRVERVSSPPVTHAPPAPQNQIWASCSDIDVVSDVTPKPANECGGTFGNNEGGNNPKPVAAGSACKCASLCQARRVGMWWFVLGRIAWFGDNASGFDDMLVGSVAATRLVVCALEWSRR